jgi:N-6 DNA Methylase
MTRLVLARRAPQHIQHYAEQTRRVVDDFAAQLQVLFEDERAGRMSPSWARTLDRLFALWCEQSGVVPPRTARTVLQQVDPYSLADVLKAVRTDLGFSSDDITQACEEYVARARAGRDRGRLLRRLEQRLYRPQIRSLCVQSAHVTLARAVLYRVLEDRGIAQRRISGPPLAAALDASAQGLVGAPSVFSSLEEMRAGSEDFLPSLYQRRELDWWLIDFPRGGNRQALFDERMGAVEVELARMLQVLDGYDFHEVDQDVWRDVYEHHLPWEERQRLGSFYTPDAIVRTVLDLVGWVETDNAIADATIADIACGSGAFLVEALRRRRSALERARRLPRDPTPEQLDHLVSGLAGLDVHPFATFLASVNLLFQVIDLYESVRRRHRRYSLALNVFTVDSLEDAGVHPRQAALQHQIPEDIRIRHTEAEIARYQELRTQRFDTVVGNPPWGGVLKGRLSPLNDPEKRREYAGRYNSATGKYDIFVLFVERSVRWLRPAGRYGFVIPSAYRDRAFGHGLRQLLADEALPTAIVDLLPFGNLLFHAMNTPTLLAGTRAESGGDVAVVSVGRDFAFLAPPAERERRHGELASAVTAALAGRPGPDVTAYTEPSQVLQTWGRRPWLVDPNRALRAAVESAGETSIGQLFEPRQGVTPGGEGVLDVLQLFPDRAAELQLEQELIHGAARGVELRAGAAAPAATVLLYPYIVIEDGWRRAFEVDAPGGESWDALGLEPRNAREAGIVAGLDAHEQHRRLVERRIAEGVCPYPAAAEYLLDNYDLLASRRPEGTAITHGGKRWWEYHRARDPVAMLAAPKLLGPRRGMLWPRFALDEQGLLPTDPCVTLSRPSSPRAHRKVARLRATLGNHLGRVATARDLWIYVMAFLNTVPAAAVLRIGRLPTAKGGWTVDGDYLATVRIAIPEDRGLVKRSGRGPTALWRAQVATRHHPMVPSTSMISSAVRLA